MVCFHKKGCVKVRKSIKSELGERERESKKRMKEERGSERRNETVFTPLGSA